MVLPTNLKPRRCSARLRASDRSVRAGTSASDLGLLTMGRHRQSARENHRSCRIPVESRERPWHCRPWPRSSRDSARSRVLAQPLLLPFIELGHTSGVEICKGLAIALALAQDGDPRQPGLRASSTRNSKSRRSSCTGTPIRDRGSEHRGVLAAPATACGCRRAGGAQGVDQQHQLAAGVRAARASPDRRVRPGWHRRD